MRLRTFSAASMSEAMALVRAQLGGDAIIVSTEDGDDGLMRVTAAVEPAELPAAGNEPDVIDALSEALAEHGVAPALVEKILGAALPFETEDPLLALSGAFTSVFRFAPLDAKERPLLMVGPPGAGKTVSIAKLAARAVMAGKPVRLVTADIVRAGGIEQLEAFARVLRLPLQRAESAARLAPLARQSAPQELLLIDTPGINPYSAGDHRELTLLIEASGGEPVLVLPAGGDSFDSIEMARIFRDLGASRMIVTRLDMVRRLGSVIAAADALNLAFAEAGISADIASGLAPIDPVVLARFLLPRPAPALRQAHSKRGFA